MPSGSALLLSKGMDMPIKNYWSRVALMLVPCFLLLVALLLLTQIDTAQAQSGDEPDRPAGWNEETHSNNVEPNYEVVFPVDKVNQITITITPENWAAMQEDMTNLYGEQGSRGGMGGPGGMNMPPGGAPPADMPAPDAGEAPVQPPDTGQRDCHPWMCWNTYLRTEAASSCGLPVRSRS